MKNIIQIIILILLTSCNENYTPNDPIEKAIIELGKRSNSDAFVIIEDSKSGRYVQFANNHTNTYFDFPVLIWSKHDEGGIVETFEIDKLPKSLPKDVERILSLDEEKRLIKYFDTKSIKYEIVLNEGRNNEGEVESYFKAIDGNLLIDSKDYKKFVINIFEKVYLLKDYEIKIIEN